MKQNASVGGALGVGLGAVEIAGAENKLKGIASVLASILAFKAGLAAMFVGTFSNAKDSMSNLIKESGSLEAALRRIGKSAEDAGDAYAKAKEKMKAGAGAAWAESEITNTKNMTRAVEAMTPAVTAASNEWAKISGGLSTAKSEMVKAAAESGVLGGAINVVSQAVGALAIGLSTIAGVALVKWLFELSSAAGESAKWIFKMEAATSGAVSGLAKFQYYALRVVQVLARWGGIGIIVSGILAVGGAIYAQIKAWDEAGNAANRMLDAALNSTRAISAQITMIKTAEDQAKAYASALDELTKAQQQWLAVKSSGKPKDSQEMQAAETARSMAEKAVKKAAAATPTEGPGSGTEPAVLAARTARAQSDAALEDRIANASEEAKPELLREKARIAAERAATGKSEVSGRSGIQKRLDEISREETANSGKEETVKQRERDARIAEIESNQAGGYFPKERTREAVLAAQEQKEKEYGEIKALRDAKDKKQDQYNPETYVDKRIEALKGGSEADKLEARNMEIQKYRRTGKGEDGTDEEISQNAVRIDELRELAGNSSGNALAARAGTAEADRGDIRATEAKTIAGIEKDIADSKAEGYLQSHEELTARWKILEAQLKTEESMGRGNSIAAENIRNKMNQTSKEVAVLNRANRIDLAESSSAAQKSLIKGDGYEVDRQKQELDLKALKAKETETNKGTDELAKQRARTAVREQENQMENSKRAHEAEVRGTQASTATSAITGAGYVVDRQKAAIERDRLVKDKAAASGDTAKARVQASIDAHDAGEREAGVAGFQKGRDIRSELERSSAMARGDSASLTRLNNFDEFKGNFDRLRADLGTDKAAEVAGKLSRDAITLRARNDMNSSNAGVASASMARIGGGGGIGPGATSMIDIQKEIKDLSKEGNVLLKEIRDFEKIKRGIPAR